MSHKLVSNFIGYRTKPDKTNVNKRALIAGSRNVLINDAEKIVVRGGYSLDGAAASNTTPILKSFDWKTSRGNERNLRVYDDELEVRFIDADGDVNWLRVADSWATTDFQFASWWDDTEKKQVLLFVVGDDNTYMWGGGVAEVLSVTSNTIKKKGSGSWVSAGFFNIGNKTISIDGTEYAYTGGETTTTLTGVTPNPVTGGVAAGDFAIQKIVTSANSPAADFVSTFIKVLNNQAYIGSSTSNLVYISSNSDYTDFSFSSPRVPGEGELFTLDDVCRGFAPLYKEMIMFSGDDDVFRTFFEQLDVGGTLVETLKSKKLSTSTGESAFSGDFIAEVGSSVVYLTVDKRLRLIQQSQQLESPIIEDLSDPIKTDFDNATWTGGHIKSNKNRIYVCDPNDSKVYILETRQTAVGTTLPDGFKRFWQAPQLLPVRRFAIIGSDLHGHSNESSETYKLFTGTSDKGLPIGVIANLAYRSYGKRSEYKSFDEWYVEGYIKSNTTLKVFLLYDFDGSKGVVEKEVNGTDDDILFKPSSGGALGDNPLGDSPLGDLPEEEADNQKFRKFFDVVAKDFYEVGVSFRTDKVDYYWEILATGGNVVLTNKQQTKQRS